MNVKEQEPEGRDFFAPAALRQSVFDPPAYRIPAPAKGGNSSVGIPEADTGYFPVDGNQKSGEKTS